MKRCLTETEWLLHLNSKLELKMLFVKGVEKTSHITRKNKTRW